MIGFMEYMNEVQVNRKTGFDDSGDRIYKLSTKGAKEKDSFPVKFDISFKDKGQGQVIIINDEVVYTIDDYKRDLDDAIKNGDLARLKNELPIKLENIISDLRVRQHRSVLKANFEKAKLFYDKKIKGKLR